MMDPNWISIGVTVFGAGLAAFVGTKVAIARIEERQKALKERVDDHEVRIRDLEHDVRPYG